MVTVRNRNRKFCNVKIRITTFQNKGSFYQLAVPFNRTNTNN